MAEKAEKISTLILVVDLGCSKCCTKIKKLLCKLKDCENIKEITYDVKNNKVTISGPFDPHCLKTKLQRKACKIIVDIQIPPPPPPVPSPAKTNPPKLPPVPVCCDKPSYVWICAALKCASCGMTYTSIKHDPKPDPRISSVCCAGKPDQPPDCPPVRPVCCARPCCAGKPDQPPDCPPGRPVCCARPCCVGTCGTCGTHPCPGQTHPAKVVDKPTKKPDQPPDCPTGRPVCCARPCYVGMYGGTICASCGMKCPWTNQGPPAVAVCNQVTVPQAHHGYGCGCAGCGQLKPYHFICEDSTPPCTIM